MLTRQPIVAILVTLLIIIIFREVSMLIAQAIGIASMGNIIGMLLLFACLMLWRVTKGLPDWLLLASNKILTESAYAYLPVSAGAGILLFQLGDEFTRIMLVMTLSTVVPLWCFAKLSSIWLADGSNMASSLPSNNTNNTDTQENTTNQTTEKGSQS